MSTSKGTLPTIVVHGGAGEIPEADRPAHVEGCRRAAQAGWEALAAGGSALDGVEAAVRVMEDDPTFDAGHGSFLNAVGEVELDAIVMNGHDLSLGAVAAVQRVRHPVSLARLVMQKSNHSFLVGPAADDFARQHGMPICPPWELLSERELERWKKFQAGEAPPPPDYFTPCGTVGAVALDEQGNLAAATSTGGTPNKLPGRVGDSPLVGCGAYADNRSAAASATGEGEALMKIVISKTTCDLVLQGLRPQVAAEAVVELLGERTGGHGGLILLDRQGRFGIAHNTSYIAYAVAAADGSIQAGICYPAKK
ncbi:MAG: isoaspartyl peptidase/L-asparaginase [Anaerolineae bacterium]|nr:isoaspartyl peptidase/L-asparaginase [Anaerolineae bacterium]